jgi:hypothetical protein
MSKCQYLNFGMYIDYNVNKNKKYKYEKRRNYRD